MNEHHTNKHDHSFNDRRAMLAGIGGLAAGALLTGSAKAGPLDPPPGPIVPTGKPLNELEPRIPINAQNTPGDADSMFKIIAPGSYYLTGNIVGLVNKHGIKVAASAVTIDLGGFMLRGLGTIQGDFDGIYAEDGRERITIRNGYIEVMGRYGINLGSATDCVVEDINAKLCLNSGISSGVRASVIRCIASDNTSGGIFAGEGSRVYACRATGNSRGFGVSSDSLVDDCLSVGNVFNGFAVGGRVTNCIAKENGGIGFESFGTTSFIGCVAVNNGSNGILVSNNSRVIGNFCHGNGSSNAGIVVFGNGSHLESNLCIDNGCGIEVNDSGNFIFRNSCSGNDVNWSISFNNYYGPIINRAGINTSPVEGNFAPSTLTSTDPHANFTY
ncbi:MAG: right-handed parallel beta-helix repeat-containing protein [Phycisphaerales bacterium]|nr:right-handed parallel beta-helix repeat-containing protein [Phycisphaerales bacterium]